MAPTDMQNSTDSQKPLSGTCAKVHGQGTAQLQLSNHSPTICQLGMSLIRTLRSNAVSPTIAFLWMASDTGGRWVAAKIVAASLGAAGDGRRGKQCRIDAGSAPAARCLSRRT
jgi:hypothetical protein